MKRKKSNQSKNEIKEKKNIKEKVSDILELPQEIMMDIPKLVFIGNKTLTIENYKGIIEYSENMIRINTKAHMLKITGKSLEIKNITAEEVMITGDILTFEFIA
ncbi:sporulation protein YqfC [Petroclostridium sp. X23]|jgi:sporulation protein YqfC|uniref:sporulation protein YqfC n=1 Tax=Petroclostridium sp. X23 TaxID=3045146 RepID=UPI0024AD00C9|nr:sporulation protein YqfC [Petroclostridium sp. X23]WHH59581.1 sporulation protein YqfC [Petroclostridium sp. X23]